jgi:hypothetical protein
MRQVVCTSESVYAGALTRGGTYEVAEVDDGARQLRVRDDRGRLRWYPTYCFATEGEVVALLASYVVDDPIEDPTADWVEVTVTLTDGGRRWCAFTTPAHVAQRGEQLEADGRSFRAFFAVPHAIVVTRLSTGVIEATLRQLDREGLLEQCTRELD